LLISKVKRFVKEFQLFYPGEKVLLGISGGVDSVVLLEVMIALAEEYHLKLAVSHYDHKIRKASVEDAKFVYGLCKRKGLPFIVSSAPVPRYAKREGLSLEMAGRELRYRCWQRLCKKYDFQKLALAHHLDDLTEEIFMRLIKGTGKRGLAGIPIKREGFVVRPLLFVTKDEILEFAEKRNLSWREDHTNKDLRFFRNKVRHLLIPFLEKNFNKNLKKSLKKTALIVSEEEELIEDIALQKFEEVKFLSEGDISLKVGELKRINPVLRRRIYFLAFREAGVPLFRIGFSHLQGIENLILNRAKGPVFLPGGYKVYRGPGYVVFTKKVFSCPYFEVKVSDTGIFDLPISKKLKVVKVPFASDWTYAGNVMAFCGDKLNFPVIVRKRKPGDRVYLPRLGHKKLKKLLWEKKIPVYLRDEVLVIEKEGELIGVWGIYIHPDYRLTESCKEAIVFQLID